MHKALELINLTDEKIALVRLRWRHERCTRLLKEQWGMEHRVALAGMRALVAWMESGCTNPDHWDFYDRDHGTRADCHRCWAELRTALDTPFIAGMEVNDG